ncbi:hypothetical protein C449_00875 [Halococcus saccharolyticus DSM 5350]|uniref:Uncharacterized protein n=1 Tax=Halococcus saccharolyticus DSM 5350 TaxID=1227455 RepID=M0MQT3_9EURY|nr:hypothetical protein C449_00875 [Halococcus saccharolyticus DSM 5350]
MPPETATDPESDSTAADSDDTTRAESGRRQAHSDGEIHTPDEDAAADSDQPDAESGGADGQERDDHRVTVTLTFDNPAAAHVAALRDAGVSVERLFSQALEQPAERELFIAHQQAKYGGQQGRGGR